MSHGKEALVQWELWNLAGFIPGPEEDEAAFQERVRFCLDLEKNLELKVGVQLPFEISDKASQSYIQEVLPQTEELYGIRPDWVLLFFSHHQLMPWHAGCAWIFQIDADSPTAAFIQIRRQFKNSATYLGLYQRQELLTHELAHVGRMLYNEPQFEEVFAYQASSSRWRCWLGPLVQSPKEILFFILILMVMMMADFALFATNDKFVVQTALWLKCIPVMLIAAAVCRLIYRQRIYRKCLHRLENLYPKKIARHLLYRLKDGEIHLFAKLDSAQILTYMQKNSLKSFRWQFLTQIYPPEAKC